MMLPLCPADNGPKKTDNIPRRVIGCVLVYSRESPRTECMDLGAAFVFFAFGNAWGLQGLVSEHHVSGNQ
jgi:hypothetical protein